MDRNDEDRYPNWPKLWELLRDIRDLIAEVRDIVSEDGVIDDDSTDEDYSPPSKKGKPKGQGTLEDFTLKRSQSTLGLKIQEPIDLCSQELPE